MRVWMIELTADYEQGTRHGIFTSPQAAWGAFFDLLDSTVMTLPSFTIEMKQPNGPGAEDVYLDVVHYVNDRLRLIGAYVKGTGNPHLTSTERRELQDVGALVAQHATKIEDFDKTIVQEYDVRRTGEDALTCVWRFVKNDA